jgi:hypothetical protein
MSWVRNFQNRRVDEIASLFASVTAGVNLHSPVLTSDIEVTHNPPIGRAVDHGPNQAMERRDIAQF